MLCLGIVYHLSNESTKNRQMVNREELEILSLCFIWKKMSMNTYHIKVYNLVMDA